MDNSNNNISVFISPCCNAFNYYENTSIYCSKCKKLIYKINDETLTISVKFNSNMENNISGDILESFYYKASRFATDPTCELCDTKCKKCGSYTRYLRDPQGNIIYICSNGNCRNVMTDLS